jgi:gamma-glutamyltranspeptidase/glutathione hydrolase
VPVFARSSLTISIARQTSIPHYQLVLASAPYIITYKLAVPAIATKGDELFLAYGVMGGFMQPQGHVQVLLNILRGFDVQAALDAPRFCISAGLPDAEVPKGGEKEVGDINAEVYFDEGIDVGVVNKLNGWY